MSDPVSEVRPAPESPSTPDGDYPLGAVHQVPLHHIPAVRQRYRWEVVGVAVLAALVVVVAVLIGVRHHRTPTAAPGSGIATTSPTPTADPPVVTSPPSLVPTVTPPPLSSVSVSPGFPPPPLVTPPPLSFPPPAAQFPPAPTPVPPPSAAATPTSAPAPVLTSVPAPTGTASTPPPPSSTEGVSLTALELTDDGGRFAGTAHILNSSGRTITPADVVITVRRGPATVGVLTGTAAALPDGATTVVAVTSTDAFVPGPYTASLALSAPTAPPPR